MLTPNEAREMAIYNFPKISIQFKEIEKLITKCAINGQLSVVMEGKLHPYVIRHLEAIGYKIKCRETEYDAIYSYYISWE